MVRIFYFSQEKLHYTEYFIKIDALNNYRSAGINDGILKNRNAFSEEKKYCRSLVLKQKFEISGDFSLVLELQRLL